MSTQASAPRHRGAATVGPEYDTHPELALAAVLQLLSRFPARRSPALARTVASHFQVIVADARTRKWRDVIVWAGVDDDQK
ncbi:MAG: hypothetical protein HUU27_10970 [Phycisphaerae bacterium]|nr:hypothetical protein [Phycisphaerae bacterium]